MKIGDKVRIKRDALDARTIKQGHHTKTFTVLDLFSSSGEQWARLGVGIIWPVRMLRPEGIGWDLKGPAQQKSEG